MSRDPIGEEGGVNVFGFVQNAPNTDFDFLGLSKDGCAPCGWDVTGSVLKTLANITSIYRLWDKKQKRTVCDELHDISGWLFGGRGANVAWDIVPLKKIGYGLPNQFGLEVGQSGLGPCARTLTFGGRCYYAGALNYLMWGHINGLCYRTFGSSLRRGPLGYERWSIEDAMSRVMMFKAFVHPTSFWEMETEQALAATVAGYPPGVSPLLRVVDCKWCQPSAKATGTAGMRWVWEPLNPRRKDD